jgi:hypothetical protein
MNPWGVPSGGDWGLYRGGAIFIEGAEFITIQHNTLTRIDGNGVFVSGYTRDVMIADNEFSWIGCSPMAAWGYTKENDGMDGQQPRYTTIARNYVHEFGHYEKQSSFWFQAKVRCAFFDRNPHSMMPLVPTPVRLKLLHACEQSWHSSRVVTLLPFDTVNSVQTLQACHTQGPIPV